MISDYAKLTRKNNLKTAGDGGNLGSAAGAPPKTGGNDALF